MLFFAKIIKLKVRVLYPLAVLRIGNVQFLCVVFYSTGFGLLRGYFTH